jgi:hypothetical protein
MYSAIEPTFQAEEKLLQSKVVGIEISPPLLYKAFGPFTDASSTSRMGRSQTKPTNTAPTISNHRRTG